jgi:hypothetical protein
VGVEGDVHILTATEPTTRNGWPADSGLEEVTCHGRNVGTRAAPGLLQRVAGGRGRRGGRRGGRPRPAQRPAASAGARRAVEAACGQRCGRSEDSGSNHTARTAGLASRLRAQKPLRIPAVSHPSALGGNPCASCQSRVALQATPALPCNSQPYVHTAALPAPLAAKQPLCLPFASAAPRKLSSSAACGRLATRDGTASGPRYDEPHAVRPGSQACEANAPPSADAIAGRTKQSRRVVTARGMGRAVACFACFACFATTPR